MHLQITLFQRMHLFYLICAWVLMGKLRGTGQGWRGFLGEAGKALCFISGCAMWFSRSDHWEPFSSSISLSVKQIHSVIICTPADLDAVCFHLSDIYLAYWYWTPNGLRWSYWGTVTWKLEGAPELHASVNCQRQRAQRMRRKSL